MYSQDALLAFLLGRLVVGLDVGVEPLLGELLERLDLGFRGSVDGLTVSQSLPEERLVCFGASLGVVRALLSVADTFESNINPIPVT